MQEKSGVLDELNLLSKCERSTLLEHILNSSPAVAFLWQAAPGWPVDFVSGNVSQFGYTPEQFTSGKISMMDILHKEDRKRIQRELAASSAGKANRSTLSFRILTGNRDTRWVDAHLWGHCEEGTRVTHYHGIFLDVTDRKLLEDVLDEEKFFINNVFNNSVDGMAVASRDGRFIAINPAIWTLFKCKPTEIRTIGDLLTILFDDTQTRNKVRQAWHNDIEKKKPSVRIFAIDQNRKAKRWFRFQLAPMGEENVLLTCQDITATKKREQQLNQARSELKKHLDERTRQLQESNEKLREEVARRQANEAVLEENRLRFENLVANVPGAVYRCRCDETWTMKYISAGIEQLSGYPPAEFIDNRVRSFASIIHPSDRQMVDRQVRRGVDQRLPYHIRYRILHRDGSIHRVIDRGRAVVAADRSPEYLDGVILDDTECLNVEATLRQSEQKVRSLLNATDDLAFLLDPDLSLLAANATAAAALNVAEDALVGQHMNPLLSQLGLPVEGLLDLRHVFDSGQPVSACLTGAKGYFEVIANPILSENGQVIRLALLLRPLPDQPSRPS